MGMKTPCLGAHSGSLKKTEVARSQNLGAPGTRTPVRQQPCLLSYFAVMTQKQTAILEVIKLPFLSLNAIMMMTMIFFAMSLRSLSTSLETHCIRRA